MTNSFKKVANVEALDNFDPKKIDRLVLPGVGSFSQFAKEISNKQKNSILEFSEMGKPILGICLGASIFIFKKF